MVVFNYVYFKETSRMNGPPTLSLFKGFPTVPINVQDSIPSEEGTEGRGMVFRPLVHLHRIVQASGSGALYFLFIGVIQTENRVLNARKAHCGLDNRVTLGRHSWITWFSLKSHKCKTQTW